MANASDASAIRAEIQFFMEKCFQASFGYVAGLLAVFAVTGVDFFAGLAAAADLRVRNLLSIVILALNLFYFTVILSCLFAVLKRGYFLLTLDSGTPDLQWERFTRRPQSNAERPMNAFAWNIDNYYMMPIFAILFSLSVGAGVVGLSTGPGWSRLIAAMLIALYALPSAILVYLYRLDGDCRRLAEDAAAERLA